MLNRSGNSFFLCALTSFFYVLYIAPTGAFLINDTYQSIDVDLASYNATSSELYFRYVDVTQGNAVINIWNIPKNQGFFVVQVHSLFSNVTLSYRSNFTLHTSVSGNNVGLVGQAAGAQDTFKYHLKTADKRSVRILLALVLYQATDPIPGGCNMIFNTKIAPYQLLSYNDNIIRVDAQPASVPRRICEANPSRLEMYHMYLYERNLDENSYFDGVRAMLTVDSIRANGRKVPEPIGRSFVRRYYSAYPGTGSVYAIIATYKNGSSAYVPIATFACNINNWDGNCIGPVTVGWKIMCAGILFLGIFTCYFGHRFFKTQMFIFGCVFGAFISYVSAAVIDDLSVGESLGIMLTFGAIYGAMWIVFWWKFGSPILSVCLPVAFIAYLAVCIAFYFGIGDIPIFQSDLNYWGIMCSVMLPMTVLLLVVTMVANILACSVLGASAITVALDHYIGGNLHYAILNNIRRATVPNFNLAITDPPFQYRDIILSVVWMFLVSTGVYVQLKRQRGRPPFPPPSFISRRNSELAPLLSEESSFPIYT